MLKMSSHDLNRIELEPGLSPYTNDSGFIFCMVLETEETGFPMPVFPIVFLFFS